jgi:hypothetical protein
MTSAHEREYPNKEYYYRGDLRALEQMDTLLSNHNPRDGVTPVLLASIASIEVENHDRRMRLDASSPYVILPASLFPDEDDELPEPCPMCPDCDLFIGHDTDNHNCLYY